MPRSNARVGPRLSAASPKWRRGMGTPRRLPRPSTGQESRVTRQAAIRSISSKLQTPLPSGSRTARGPRRLPSGHGNRCNHKYESGGGCPPPLRKPAAIGVEAFAVFARPPRPSALLVPDDEFRQADCALGIHFEVLVASGSAHLAVDELLDRV